MNRFQKQYNISIQQVQIFLKAVELKNFTQVANYFNFTPSMISKTISFMESELELELFIRNPHELRPTPAALLLAGEWRQFISSFQKSIERARACQNDQKHKIILGFVDSSASIDQMIRQVMIQYTRLHPHMDIIVEKHDMHRLSELLNHGLLDLILTSDFEAAYLSDHGLPWEKAFDSSIAAFVPRGNNLFQKDALAFSDLKGQPLISLDPVMHPSYAQWLYTLCSRFGFVPNVKSTFRTVRSLLFSLKIQDSIFIGDFVNSDWCDEDLKVFPLPEKAFSLLAWRESADRELVEFKDYLKEYCRTCMEQPDFL